MRQPTKSLFFKLCQMGYVIYTDFLMDAYAGFEKKHLH